MRHSPGIPQTSITHTFLSSFLDLFSFHLALFEGVGYVGYAWKCVCVFAIVWAHTCEELKSTSRVSIGLYPFYLLRQGLSVEPRACSWTSLASRLSWGILCLCLLGTGITGMCQHTWFMRKHTSLYDVWPVCPSLQKPVCNCAANMSCIWRVLLTTFFFILIKLGHSRKRGTDVPSLSYLTSCPV